MPLSFIELVRADLKEILLLEGRAYTFRNQLWAWFGLDAFMILLLFRLRGLLKSWHIPFANRLLRGLQTCLYGIELGSDIELGIGVYFVHSVGVVVGGKAKIGRGVRFMGSNTIGTAQNNGFPTLDDYVLVSPGARILGPVHIGSFSTIAANAVVLRDVPSKKIAAGMPAVIKDISPTHLQAFYPAQLLNLSS